MILKDGDREYTISEGKGLEWLVILSLAYLILKF